MSNFFAGKRVLVAGAGGFIGTNLVARLVDHGAQVIGTLHERPPQARVRGVNYITADLTRMENCIAVSRDVDYVFMAAANSSGAAVMESRPLVHLTPNVVMNSQMLAAAYENQVKKFCFISSNTVYPVTDFAVTEGDAGFDYFEKYFVVGWMKRFSEIMCEMYAKKIKNKMSVLIARPGNLYGPFDKFNPAESKVVAALIRRAVERQNPFVVWGDGNDIKDFLYIEDFISGLLLAFERSASFDIFNIASGAPVTVRELLREVLHASNHLEVEVRYDDSMPTMIPKRLIDIKKLSDATGWVPSTTLAEGIASTVRWYRERHSDAR